MRHENPEERLARLCAFVASLPAPRRPPLVLPEELGVKIEDIFHHADPAALPELADVLEHLMEHHPRVLAAVGDVDRSLIWDAMGQRPIDRLLGNERMASDIASMQEAMRRARPPHVA
jgi:hypothetical protein